MSVSVNNACMIMQSNSGLLTPEWEYKFITSYYHLCSVFNCMQLSVSPSYLCLFLCLWMHINATTAASVIIPVNNTPPTPATTATIFPELPGVSPATVSSLFMTPVVTGDVESVPTVVGLVQFAWAVSELTSIGQLGYTSIMLPSTRMYA